MVLHVDFMIKSLNSGNLMIKSHAIISNGIFGILIGYKSL